LSRSRSIEQCIQEKYNSMENLVQEKFANCVRAHDAIQRFAAGRLSDALRAAPIQTTHPPNQPRFSSTHSLNHGINRLTVFEHWRNISRRNADPKGLHTWNC
jgi:hypothetical protein